jgi:hypothetical protein
MFSGSRELPVETRQMSITYHLQPSMFNVERMKLPQRQASKTKLPMKVRELSLELSGRPMLR